MEELRIGRVVVILAFAWIFVGASALSILLAAPVADAGEDQTVDVGETVQFDGSGSQNAASYYWNFRDNGWVNTSPAPTRSYRTEGVYDVGLVVTSATGMQNHR
jgi:PKD repeat protein